MSQSQINIPESAMKEGKNGGGVLFTECLLGARYYVSASPRLPHLILTTILKGGITASILSVRQLRNR